MHFQLARVLRLAIPSEHVPRSRRTVRALQAMPMSAHSPLPRRAACATTTRRLLTMEGLVAGEGRPQPAPRAGWATPHGQAPEDEAAGVGQRDASAARAQPLQRLQALLAAQIGPWRSL